MPDREGALALDLAQGADASLRVARRARRHRCSHDDGVVVPGGRAVHEHAVVPVGVAAQAVRANQPAGGTSGRSGCAGPRSHAWCRAAVARW